MRILITGGTGFLGRNLQNEFLNQLSNSQIKIYSSIITISNKDTIIEFPNSSQLNLTSLEHTKLYFEQFRPNIVLHAASLCGGIGKNLDFPADFIHTNIKIHSNVFDAVSKYNVNKIYGLGSVCMFGMHCPTPFKEDDIWLEYPESSNAPYGESKRLLLMLHKTYRQQYNIGGGFLIPVNLFGFYDSFNERHSHVVPALIRKFVYAVENNKSIVECWGSGNATRELLFASDCCSAIVKATLTGFDYPEPINLGTGRDISIKNLAYLIAKLTGYKGDVVFTGEVSDGQPKRQLDVSRAKELLGWEAKTSLEDGLIKTISWYKENKELIKD